MLHTAFEQYTLADLLALTGDKPKRRAQKSKVFGIQTRKNQRRFLFLVKSRESYSHPDGHLVSVLYPNLPLLPKLRGMKGISPTNQRVRVHCTCPAWSHWGSAYWATEEGYALRGLEDREPNIRDPQGENLICKHVARVSLNLQRLSFTRLLDWFKVPTAKQATAELQAIRRVAAKALQDRGLTAALADTSLEGLTVDNFEDLLEQQGLVVSDQPLAFGQELTPNFLEG